MDVYKKAWTSLGSLILTLGTNAPRNNSFPRGSIINQGTLEILQIAAWFMGRLSTGLPSNSDQKLTIRPSLQKSYFFWSLNTREVNIIFTFSPWSQQLIYVTHLSLVILWRFFLFSCFLCKLDPIILNWKESTCYPKIMIKLWLLEIIVQGLGTFSTRRW